MVLGYYRMFQDVEAPAISTAGSSCMDVKAYFGTKCRLLKAYNRDNAEIQRLVYRRTEEEPYHFEILPGERVLIPTGLILQIPTRYSVRLHPRSGLSLKFGLTLVNCEGVIDEDYVEPLYVALTNVSNEPVTIKHGDRVAQMELVKIEEQKIEEVKEQPQRKTDRAGGFGSTGV